MISPVGLTDLTQSNDDDSAELVSIRAGNTVNVLMNSDLATLDGMQPLCALYVPLLSETDICDFVAP